jgi:hypothetical protein
VAYGQLNISSINGSGLENNLLINPEFTINQRGAATPTTTSNAYNYDSWYYDGTYLYQGIEGNNLRATTYTLSWTGAMTASYSLNTGAASTQSGQSWTSVSNGANITIASVGSNNLWIRFSSQPTQPKLELGTSQTTFVPRLYGQELALCQRYLPKLESTTGAYAVQGGSNSSTSAAFTIPFSVKARTAPTGIRYTLAGGVANYGAAGQAVTNLTFAYGTIDLGAVLATVASGLTPGYSCVGALPAILFTGCEL